jgi:hypothetical protein
MLPRTKYQVRKVQKSKKERMEERNKYCYVHTCVFFIGRECPQATALVRPSLKRTHSYGNLPYNKRKLEYNLWVSKFLISFQVICHALLLSFRFPSNL